jgi:hypothetical protein
MLTVGVFAPVVAGVIGVGRSPGDLAVLITVLGAFAISMFLHLLGRHMLGGLEE